MENAARFVDKIRRGHICLGVGITFTDPTVTEALCSVADFVWIDMEHNALSLETVQAHIMATKGSDTIPLVRARWNDPVLIKPILDIGAAGVIVPMVRTADEARRFVAACLYPPDGIRGFGPRRPSNYGHRGGPAFCQTANDTVITIAQIEHVDAVKNLDDILSVPGLTSIVIGPQDLAGSMGHIGEPRHPEVLRTIETVIARTRQSQVLVGIGSGDDPNELIEWADKGAQWLQMGGDYNLLLRAAHEISTQVQQQVGGVHG